MKEELVFETGKDFREWLEENARDSAGVWLLFSKTSRPTTLSSEEALEQALCFGWIDGLINRIDGEKYKKYFSRRRKGSDWSDKNRKTAERLIGRGLMTESGLSAIEEAKTNGRWYKIRDRSISEVQREEFKGRIEGRETAFAHFTAMPQSVQKQFIGFYFEAKREETRRKRLEKIVGLLEKNRRLM